MSACSRAALELLEDEPVLEVSRATAPPRD